MRNIALYSIVILATFISCGHKTNQIGVVLSLSGKGSIYGERALHGMLIAQDELNRTGFTQNKINLIVEDSKSKPSDALFAFNKLINLNKVNVVLGMVLSDEVLTCAQTANKNKVVILTPGAGSIEITNAGPYIFRNRESAFIQAKMIAEACMNMKNNKITVMYSQAANGISYKEAFKREYLKLGGNIIAEIGFIEGVNDYKSEIKKVFDSNANGIYIAGLDREIGLILKQAKELGYKSQFYASAGAVSPNLINIAGNATEGLITVSESFDSSDSLMAKTSFVKIFKEKYGKDPDWVSANSYEALMIIGKLIKSGLYTGEQIKNGLDTINYSSFSERIKFDENGDVIKNSRLIIVQNGEFKKYILSH